MLLFCLFLGRVLYIGCYSSKTVTQRESPDETRFLTSEALLGDTVLLCSDSQMKNIYLVYY